MFNGNLDSGMWCKVVNSCILYPSNHLSKLLTAELTFCIINRNPGMDTNMVAKEYISQRFQSLLAAKMVTCVKNHSRWLSVATSMKIYSPKMFEILTKYCKMVSNSEASKKLEDFVIRDTEKTLSPTDVATNTAALLCILTALYVEDRPFHSATNKDQIAAKWKHLQEYEPEYVYSTVLRDKHGGETHLCGNDRTDKGANFINVVNTFRNHFLNLPKSSNPTGEGFMAGQCWSLGGGKQQDEYPFKFGKHSLLDWSEQSIQFFFADELGGIVEDALDIDKFLHVIATGGFASAQEEAEWWTNNDDSLNPDKTEDWEEIKNTGSVGRRIVATRKFWIKVESTSKTLNNMLMKKPKGKKEQNPQYDWKKAMTRLFSINGGSPNWDSFFDASSAEEEASDKRLHVSCVFTKTQLKNMTLSPNFLLAQAEDYHLKYHHLAIHQALHDLATNDTSFDYSILADCHNYYLQKKVHKDTFGDIMTTEVEKDFTERVAKYKALLKASYDHLVKEQGADDFVMNVEGESNALWSNFS